KAAALEPILARLPHRARDLETYRALLPCPVELGGETLSVTFRKVGDVWSTRPLGRPTAEPDSPLAQHLASLPNLQDPIDLVRYRLRSHLAAHQQVPSLQHIGHALSWRPRTLQDRLRRQGLTWRELVD